MNIQDVALSTVINCYQHDVDRFTTLKRIEQECHVQRRTATELYITMMPRVKMFLKLMPQ
jgi:hypothetical protein